MIELGTKKYPYKNVALPFVEILNFHSHSNRSVNIYLKEYSVNYINQKRNYIINMTKVNIESYSTIVSTPSSASLYGVDKTLNVWSAGTITNLLVNDTLKFSSKITQSGMSTYEVQALSNADSNIFVHRTNLVINRVNLYRNILTDYQTKSNFVRAVYLQEKSVTMTNLDIQVTGFILYTEDPMSLYVDNVYIDYHATMGGYVMRIS